MSVGQTRVIAVSFPSIRYVLTQSLNFPRAFVVVGYRVNSVTDVHGADEPIDFQAPDWHWPRANPVCGKEVLQWTTTPASGMRPLWHLIISSAAIAVVRSTTNPFPALQDM